MLTARALHGLAPFDAYVWTCSTVPARHLIAISGRPSIFRADDLARQSSVYLADVWKWRLGAPLTFPWPAKSGRLSRLDLQSRTVSKPTDALALTVNAIARGEIEMTAVSNDRAAWTLLNCGRRKRNPLPTHRMTL